MRKNNKGFSLVELLVVVTIIAILSVTAYMALGGQTVKAKNSKRLQDLSTIQSALEVYFIEFSEYPSTTPLTSGSAAGEIPRKYLSEVPVDPEGPNYYYWTDGATYILGASLQLTDADAAASHIVGNSESTVAAAGFNNIDGTGGTCGVAVGVEDCFPVTLP
ncbi:prepilin-type N-terminal cleavage/methylation domain-containing protein [Patescibacteria group bacterium]|nr:prepilin-type N-terminal cleavage/methylation domain-containing protein [Patescibacteria group bacterium]